MKRPEYVAVVTSVYAAALREHREPTRDELSALERAFSRSGFTQGYFESKKGPAMFGTRAEADAPDEGFYAAARASYQKERPLVDVTMEVFIQESEPLRLLLRDDTGNEVTVLGLPPEAARTRPLTEGDVREQLAKTGGTPYRAARLDVHCAQGVSVPKSALNALRRAALDELTALRAAPPRRPKAPDVSPSPVSSVEPPPGAPRLVFSLSGIDQLTPALATAAASSVIDLPLHLIAAHPDQVKTAQAAGAEVRAALPTILWDVEAGEARRQLQAAAALGVRAALVNSWDAAWLAKEEGFALHGDYGLGVLNHETLQALQALGFACATLSFEQKLTAIKRLPKPLPTEAIIYGRLPLMTLEQFPGGQPCGSLTDRKNVTFPVVSAPGGRARVLNSQPLYLADKDDWKTAGLTYARLLFTVETPRECLDVIENYKNSAPPAPGSFTRGLYYRDVE